jgi:6-phosphogluconolactonase
MRSDARSHASFTEHRFGTTDALADALAHAIAQALGRALDTRGGATLVVPGGATPRATFERLARKPLRWSAVTVTLSDERWVPPGDPASNESLVRGALLTGPAAAANFVGLYTGDPTPEAAEHGCSDRITRLARPFDAVLLGMGEDGHIASLFPGATKLAEGLALDGRELCRAMRAPGSQQRRMTLTLSALLDARILFLLFQGACKRAAFDAALAEGPSEAMPVRALLRQRRVPVEIYWTPAD